MTKIETAKAFSSGEFKKIFDSIAENSECIIVEENYFKGKKAIIDNCI